MKHPQHKPASGLLRGAAWLLALVLMAGAGHWAWRDAERLDQARSASSAVWDEVAQVYAQRNRLAEPALQNARRDGSFNPQLVAAVRQALDRAAALPARPELLDDARALDEFKRNQGELTGLLFQLVITASQQPALHEDAALQALHRQLIEAEGRLAAARQRYRRAAGDYNTLTESLPSAITARLAGYAAVPPQL